ncbi:MAG TPA: hypothetical protein VGX78_20340 [Pirellulales bacterium]|jgi:hypothetical protein|nr:hypothetical protein [Pirellulales bacterium]
MASATLDPKELAMLKRLVGPSLGNLTTEAARAILTINFSDGDRERVRELSEKARQGTLSHVEQAELDCFVRVEQIIGLMHSKARTSLKERSREGN